MDSVDYTKVKIEEKNLHIPLMEEVVDVLSRGLKDTFEQVTVTAEQCPDLTKPPYNLKSPGISGDVKLVELGGPPYLLPLAQREKIYDLEQLLKYLNRDPAFIAGAGAGSWPFIGVNCEGIVNLSVRNGALDQGTRVMTVEPVGAPKGHSGYKQHRLPNNETRTALLGNYVISNGLSGQVIKVVAKKRIGESNFITAIRETLHKYFGDQVVGLGGAFLLRQGLVKNHIMPDFSTTPICSDTEVDDWLHFFEMKAPIMYVGTLVTGDLGMDLRVQHFHGWGEHGDGGHYHYDTTPQTVHYEGYFIPAQSVIRVDAPTSTHAFGRD